MVKNANNPQQMFEKLLTSNPEFKSAVDTINSMGDPKQLFYTLAQKQGTNPDSILGLLT